MYVQFTSCVQGDIPSSTHFKAGTYPKHCLTSKIKTVNYFCKRPSLRFFTGLWMRLCFKTHKISTKWNMSFIYKNLVNSNFKSFQKNFQLNLIDLPHHEFTPRRKVSLFLILFWIISRSSTSVSHSDILSVLAVWNGATWDTLLKPKKCKF